MLVLKLQGYWRPSYSIASRSPLLEAAISPVTPTPLGKTNDAITIYKQLLHR